MLQMFRQIGDVDEVPRRRNARARDDILEFTHVARPRMLEQERLRPTGQTGNIFPVSGVVFFHEEMNEQRNIFQPFGKRWNADLNRAQAIKKIFPKMPRQELSAQIPDEQNE